MLIAITTKKNFNFFFRWSTHWHLPISCHYPCQSQTLFLAFKPCTSARLLNRLISEEKKLNNNCILQNRTALNCWVYPKNLLFAFSLSFKTYVHVNAQLMTAKSDYDITGYNLKINIIIKILCNYKNGSILCTRKKLTWMVELSRQVDEIIHIMHNKNACISNILIQWDCTHHM